VTARHVANALVGPFIIGINDSSGKLDLCDLDAATWHCHQDSDVDVAVLPAVLESADWQPFPFEGFADHENSALFSRFGVGDLVYIVGLYRLFPGKERISPVVHTGHVAMTPDEEIPVLSPTGRVIPARGYLIEAQTLKGLSGSPVFVRYTNPTGISSGIGRVVAYSDSVYLLGLWHGAWDGTAAGVLSEELGRGVRVPVGMGLTIPAKRIAEVLESPDLQQQRESEVKRLAASMAATMDSPSICSREDDSFST
jgi:hypothetical protein